MVLKALIIGINYIGSDLQLNGCIEDAGNVFKMLIENMNFHPNNITLMFDYSITEYKPTYSNIINQILKLTENLQNGDKLYFHYSGHGTQILDINGDETDGYDECLVPLDYEEKGFITDDILREILADRIPNGVCLSGVLDCCNSGTGFDLRYKLTQKVRSRKVKIQRSDFSNSFLYWLHKTFNGKYKDEYYENIEIEVSNNNSITQGVVVMLSGCRDDQVSLDIKTEDQVGGALTLAYIDTMRENNYNITCENLLTSVRDKVKNKYKSSQIPQISLGRSSNTKSYFWS